MKKLSVIAAAAVLTGIIALLAGGCASSRSGEVYSRDHARQAQTVMMGTVESVKSVTIEGTKTPVGTAAGGVAGGVLGSTVGGGSGRTVATVIGALAGLPQEQLRRGMTRNRAGDRGHQGHRHHHCGGSGGGCGTVSGGSGPDHHCGRRHHPGVQIRKMNELMLNL